MRSNCRASPPEEAASLLAATPLKIGEPLTRDNLHDAMQALFATGRFADIQAEADRTETAGVRLRFLTVRQFFRGHGDCGRRFDQSVREPTGQRRPACNSANSTRGRNSTAPWPASNAVMEENGFHQSKADAPPNSATNSSTRSTDLSCRPRARAPLSGEITLEGDAGYSIEQMIKEIAKLALRRSGGLEPHYTRPADESAAAIRSRIVCSPRFRWPAALTIRSATPWTMSSKSIAARS